LHETINRQRHHSENDHRQHDLKQGEGEHARESTSGERGLPGSARVSRADAGVSPAWTF